MSELLSPPDSAKAAVSAAVSDAGSQAKLNAHSGDPLWWRWGFALLSLILCAAAPLTAAVHGSYARSREIEIARQTKQMELEIAQRKEDYALRLQFSRSRGGSKVSSPAATQDIWEFSGCTCNKLEIAEESGRQAATPRSPCRPDTQFSVGLHASITGPRMRGCEVGGHLFATSEIHLVGCLASESGMRNDGVCPSASPPPGEGLRGHRSCVRLSRQRPGRARWWRAPGWPPRQQRLHGRPSSGWAAGRVDPSGGRDGRVVAARRAGTPPG